LRNLQVSFTHFIYFRIYHGCPLNCPCLQRSAPRAWPWTGSSLWYCTICPAHFSKVGTNIFIVGATSGIGEYTAKAFVHNTISPHVYIVGRNGEAAERIIKECKALNSDGEVEFIKADVTELKEVDRVCQEIKTKEKHINLLVQSQGNLNLRGRDGWSSLSFPIVDVY
jgi:hypothetical protein